MTDVDGSAFDLAEREEDDLFPQMAVPAFGGSLVVAEGLPCTFHIDGWGNFRKAHAADSSTRTSFPLLSSPAPL